MYRLVKVSAWLVRVDIMGNVVSGKFKHKQELVYGCVDCEGQAFWLNVGGTITCKVCSLRQRPPLNWIKDSLGLHDEVIETDEEDVEE